MSAPENAPTRAQRGRGASSNRTGRFEPRRTDPVDDGWDTIEEQPERLATTIVPEACRNPFATNESPDVPFDISINPYRGCEHGCAYCFARSSHAYLGLSAGLDFETRIFAKPDASRRLRQIFERRGYIPQVVAMAPNTDCYQPAERELRITRGILEVFAEHRHPISIVTKSQLVLRDVDLLSAMARQNLASVLISITTLDDELALRMEPRATSPRGRLQIIRRLSSAGVPCGILASPMIPGLNDTELERILELAAEAGCRSAGYILLRLPREVRDIFTEWLRHHYPRRADKVLGMMKEMHGEKLYRSEYGARMRGTGPYADALERRFELSCRRFGLSLDRTELDTSQFCVPAKPGQNLELFEG